MLSFLLEFEKAVEGGEVLGSWAFRGIQGAEMMFENLATMDRIWSAQTLPCWGSHHLLLARAASGQEAAQVKTKVTRGSTARS